MSNDEIRLIDELRQRLDASYEEAAEALREAGGDMVQALAVLERRRRERGEGLVNISSELIDEIKRLASEGVARKLRVKLGERPVAEISVTFGQAAAVVLSIAADVILAMLKDGPYCASPGRVRDE